MKRRTRRLLTVGHSYVVTLNRRLAHEMARVGQGDWQVVCAAPRFFQGSRDLAPVSLEYGATEPCPIVPLSARLTSSAHLFAYGSELRSLLRSAWDVVHVWEEPYVLAGFQICHWAPTSTRLVYWTAQSNPKKYPPPFSWFEQQCMSRAAGWICPGQSVLDNLKERPGYTSPSLLSPLGVDTEAFYPDALARARVRQALGWAESGPPVVGYLGRFVPEKGLELMMRVLDRITVPWRVLFVGAGEMEGELRAWGELHGDRVRVVKARHSEVPAYLNAMDFLCAPSQTTRKWREQFGRMLVEAFSCKLPVIGSDSGEIAYVIGDAGLVVGEQDEVGWERAISQLLESAEQRATLGELGYERAQSQFAWPLVARQYLEFFDHLLSEPPA